MAVVEKFGKYLLLDNIAEGGMATIRRAKFLDKVVIIKMIKSNFASDIKFKNMFIDEIKTSFALTHPNIAQIYDYGEKDNELFCAMEYVSGNNLRDFFEKCIEKEMQFPIDIALYITSQVCAGLQYTHNFKDAFSGSNPQIIHRDISPNNIMISHEGNVKIIDFGIAKALTNSQKTTEVGSIKCNAGYAGPEYIRGEELDHRYDQFSVAVVLWELLAGRSLFESKDTILTLQKVKQCKAQAPSKFNKLVTGELDKILLKALSKDPKKRFKNIEDFGRVLTKELYKLYPGFNPGDLKYFSEYLFADEIFLETQKCQELHNQTKNFQLIEQTKVLPLKEKSKEVKKTKTKRKVIQLNTDIHTRPITDQYQSFKLHGKIEKFKLFYMLVISLFCGFLLGENYLKEIFKSWLFGE